MSGSHVLPLTVFQIVLTVVHFVFGGLLLKNSLWVCTDTEKQKKHIESAKCGCLSSVHGWAIVYYICFGAFSLALLFRTNVLIQNPNCVVVQFFGTITSIFTRSAQHCFFIIRLFEVFKGSNLEYPKTNVILLLVVVGIYIVSGLGVLFITIGNVANTRVVVGKYTICLGQDSTPWVIFTLAVIFIVTDTTVMVSVVYGFVKRLLQTAKFAPNDRKMYGTLHLAFKSLVLFLFTWISSYFVLAGLIFGAGDQMISSVGPQLDGLLNGLAIFAVFRDGEWLYSKSCVIFSPCVSCCVLCCCVRNDPELRSDILQVAFPKSKRANFVATVSTTAGSPPEPTTSQSD